MKNIIYLIIGLNVFITYAQVGIGTTNPQEELEVHGSVRIVDGNQAKDNILVSDANGTGTWTNVTDGVRIQIIRKINQGVNTEFILWNHPKNIEVRFDTTNEVVYVENKSGDTVHNWNVTIYGGSTGYNTVESTNYKVRNILDGAANDTISFDIGDLTGGWFNIIAANQNNQKDGFIINVVYNSDDFNGTVQYWNE